MTRRELDRAFRRAVRETRDRIRRDWRDLPTDFAPLAQVIAEHFCDPKLTVREARILSGVARGTPPLGKTLAAYIAECQVKTALRIVELGDGRIPTGRAAAAVGLDAFSTWCQAVKRIVGEAPPLVRLEPRLTRRFDELSWHLACRRQLPPDHVRALLARLLRLHPGVLVGGTPKLRHLPWLPSAPAPRGTGISLAAGGSSSATTASPARSASSSATASPRPSSGVASRPRCRWSSTRASPSVASPRRWA